MGKKKQFFNGLLSLLLVVSFCSAALATPVDEMTLMTEEYPPFNFENRGKLEGVAVDLLEAMLAKVGSARSRGDFQLLPWSKGYDAVLNKPGSVLFSTTRTEHRENLFKWVGPLAPARVGVMGLKASGIKINKFADLTRHKIGAIREDIGEQLLLEGGMAKDAIDSSSTIEANIKKLKKGRIDLWAYDETVAKWSIKNDGYNTDEFETVYILKEAELYYAFHKSTPDAVINELQNALDELKKAPADGGLSPYEKIVARYSK